jgi:hypothetical protein
MYYLWFILRMCILVRTRIIVLELYSPLQKSMIYHICSSVCTDAD